MANELKIVKAASTTQGKLKMVVYGNSGVGKTVFASTAPKPLFLSVEAGLLSIAHKDIDVVEINSTEDLNGAFDLLKNGKHQYESVVLDSLTEMMKRHQDELLAKSGAVRL